MINSMIIRCCFRSTALFSKCLPCLHPMDKYELLVISLGRWDKEQNRRYAIIISSYRYFRQLGSYHQKPRQYRSLTAVFCLFVCFMQAGFGGSTVPNPKTGLICGQAVQAFCLKSSRHQRVVLALLYLAIRVLVPFLRSQMGSVWPFHFLYQYMNQLQLLKFILLRT